MFKYIIQALKVIKDFNEIKVLGMEKNFENKEYKPYSKYLFTN